MFHQIFNLFLKFLHIHSFPNVIQTSSSFHNANSIKKALQISYIFQLTKEKKRKKKKIISTISGKPLNQPVFLHLINRFLTFRLIVEMLSSIIESSETFPAGLANKGQDGNAIGTSPIFMR